MMSEIFYSVLGTYCSSSDKVFTEVDTVIIAHKYVCVHVCIPTPGVCVSVYVCVFQQALGQTIPYNVMHQNKGEEWLYHSREEPVPSLELVLHKSQYMWMYSSAFTSNF